jgi:hypothetical protein
MTQFVMRPGRPRKIHRRFTQAGLEEITSEPARSGHPSPAHSPRAATQLSTRLVRRWLSVARERWMIRL